MAEFPVPMPAPGEMLRRRRRKMLSRKRYLTLGRRTVLLGAAVWLAFSQVFVLHRNEGLGMFPAVKDGDLILGCRMRADYQKEDVILYRLDGEVRLGRVVAMGTDVVMMDETGSLLVNGSIQNGQILYPTYARENTAYPQRVPEESVYVLGDHRTQSRDSRDHGCVPLEDVMGKVIAVFRRRGI